MTILTPSLDFAAAADLFISMRKATGQPGQLSARYVRLNTERDYQSRAKSLGLFFNQMTLESIQWHNMRAYQEARIAGAHPFIRRRRPHQEPAPCPAKPQQVNQETQFLKRLMKLATCWTDEHQRYYRELQEEESDIQRALTPEEQAHWLDTARGNPRWELIYHYSVVAFDTCMSTNEVRMLRVGDVNQQHRLIDIPWPAAKNRYRHRTIAIESADTLWSLDWLLARARSLGAVDLQHYLFPFRDPKRNEYVPKQHMTSSGLKRAWQEMREASALTWFRPYDSRHTGATRHAERGVPVDVIMARMGHASDRMRRHYTHISVQAQRQWLRPEPYAMAANGGAPKMPSSSSYGPPRWVAAARR